MPTSREYATPCQHARSLSIRDVTAGDDTVAITLSVGSRRVVYRREGIGARTGATSAPAIHLKQGEEWAAVDGDYPTVRETLRYPAGREASERRLTSPPVHDALAARRVTAERS